MEGQQYYTVNPDTFVDDQLWSYRDLQKLAKAVGIRANVGRADLITNLQTWHRLRKYGTQTLVKTNDEGANVQNFDMNVTGNNFAILAVNVKEKASSGKSAKRRSSIVGLGENESGVVSPTLLRPLRQEPSTPGKSCLKKPKVCTDQQNTENTPPPGNCQAPSTPTTTKRLSNICFSPFNSVKVIAHRDELAWDEYCYREEETYKQQLRREEEEYQRQQEELARQEAEEPEISDACENSEPVTIFSPAKSLLRFCASLMT